MLQNTRKEQITNVQGLLLLSLPGKHQDLEEGLTIVARKVPGELLLHLLNLLGIGLVIKGTENAAERTALTRTTLVKGCEKFNELSGRETEQGLDLPRVVLLLGTRAGEGLSRKGLGGVGEVGALITKRKRKTKGKQRENEIVSSGRDQEKESKKVETKVSCLYAS